jgi:TPP-dependent pyruvate/acetoin dehydrogenase alpha subunit
MEERGLLTADQRQALDERITAEIDEALEWAEQSPLPDPGTQAEGVYADPV